MSNVIYGHINATIENTVPTPPSNSCYFYPKYESSQIFLYTKDENGIEKRMSPPMSSNGYILRYDGSNWVGVNTMRLLSSEITINESQSNSMDFRIKSLNYSNHFFINTNTNNIGINNASPNSDTIIDIDGDKPLRISNNSSPTFTSTPETGMIHYNLFDNDFNNSGISMYPKISAAIGNSSPVWKNLNNTLNHKGYGIKKVSSNYNILNTDYLILCDVFSNAITAFLPSSPYNEMTYIIKRINTAAFPLIVDGNGYTINGSATYVLGSETVIKITFYTTNNQWNIISSAS